LLAFVAVVMPRSWMEISNAWLGLAKTPDGPLLMLMISSCPLLDELL
jgi:hypothetical protein